MTRLRPLLCWSAAALTAGLLCACGSSTGSGSGAAAVPAAPTATADALTATALQDLESALGEQGRGGFKDTFGALGLDSSAGRVVLFATDESRARELVAAAARAHPGIDTRRAEIRRSVYSRAVIDPVIRRIGEAARGTTLPFPVYTAAITADASGITVTTSKEGTTSAALREAVAKLAGSVPVSYQQGDPVRNLDATAQVAPPP
ncbi:hypothetical protein AB0O91_20615 [Kitasatospora sp. NPDC089797]|uniref:hypothetical protein n=1 Tax=Kitasatospora sp. NPDC089797 TaxID=3155298 RepID=UPI003420E366